MRQITLEDEARREAAYRDANERHPLPMSGTADIDSDDQMCPYAIWCWAHRDGLHHVSEPVARVVADLR